MNPDFRGLKEQVKFIPEIRMMEFEESGQDCFGVEN